MGIDNWEEAIADARRTFATTRISESGLCEASTAQWATLVQTKRSMIKHMISCPICSSSYVPGQMQHRSRVLGLELGLLLNVASPILPWSPSRKAVCQPRFPTPFIFTSNCTGHCVMSLTDVRCCRDCCLELSELSPPRIRFRPGMLAIMSPPARFLDIAAASELVCGARDAPPNPSPAVVLWSARGFIAEWKRGFDSASRCSVAGTTCFDRRRFFTRSTAAPDSVLVSVINCAIDQELLVPSYESVSCTRMHPVNSHATRSPYSMNVRLNILRDVVIYYCFYILREAV
jgi:hypothetical protein